MVGFPGCLHPFLLALAAPEAGTGEIGGYGTLLLEMVLSLALVCGLAYLTLRLVRRRLGGVTGAGRTAPGLLRLVTRCPLDPQRSLCIAEAAGRFFLLGIGDGPPVLLAELPAEQVKQHESQDASAAGAVRSLWDLWRRTRSATKAPQHADPEDPRDPADGQDLESSSGSPNAPSSPDSPDSPGLAGVGGSSRQGVS